MELISVLEKRVEALLVYVKELALRNTHLANENDSLRLQNKEFQERADNLEKSLVNMEEQFELIKTSTIMHGNELNEMQQEKALAKLIIEDLIKNIEASSVGEQLS